MLKNKTSIKYLMVGFFIVIFAFITAFVYANFSVKQQDVYAATYTNNGFTYSDVSGGLNVDSYSGTATSVAIPETYDGKRIVSISQTAFKNKTAIQTISIPRYVVLIGVYIGNYGVTTFDGCTNLISITVAAGNNYYKSDGGVLYSIDDKGDAITLICYPQKKTGASYAVLDKTRHIGSGAFNSNDIVTTVTLPDSLTDIGNYAFSGCSVLSNVRTNVNYTIPSSVNFIGDYAFQNASALASIDINPGAPEKFFLGQNAFVGTSLPVSSSIIYSTGNKWILGTTGNKSAQLTVPNTVVGIASGAFAGHTITNVVFTATAKIAYIGAGAFNSCLSFRSISFSNVTTLRHIGAYAFANNRNASFTSVALPSGLVTIGEGAFYSCWNLSTINVPGTVTTVGKQAFHDTKAYTNTTNNTLFVRNNWVLGVKGSVTGTPTLTNMIGIADSAFAGQNITTANIPNTVRYIGQEAFKGCLNLTTVRISANVEEIAPYAFSACTKINTIEFNYGTGTGTKKIGDYAFSGSISYTNCTLTIPSSIKEIGEYAFYNASKITSLSLSSVNIIGHYAFQNCTSITSVTFPSTIQKIGRFAFSNTGAYNSAANGVVYMDKWAIAYKGDKSGVASLTIADDTEGIATLAFNNMPALKKVILPDSLTIIDDHAFYMCHELEQVMLKRTSVQGGTQIGLGVYNNVDLSQLGNYVVPESVNTYKTMNNWSDSRLSPTISALSNVTVSASSGGSVSGTNGYYFPGDAIPVEATPNTSNYFSGWSVSGSVKNRGVSYSYIAEPGNINLLGSFAAITTANITQTYANTPFSASFNAPNYTTTITYRKGTQVLAAAPTDAGSYTAQIDVKYGSVVVGTKTVTITINKRSVTITAYNQTINYGDSPPSYTIGYSNLAQGESTLNAVATSAYTKGNNAGNYPIAITRTTYTNYTPTYNDGQLTVNKLYVEIIADDKTINYGQAMPTLTYQISGTILAGDTLSPSPAPYVDGYTQGQTLNAGSYDILLNIPVYTNYDAQPNNGTLTINQIEAPINASSTQTYTYDGTQKNVVASHPSGASLEYYPQQGYIYANESGYLIDITFYGDINYLYTSKTVSLVINKRDLVVTANQVSKEYGFTDPVLSYSHSPQLAQGDSFSGALTREAGEAIGLYDISQGNLYVNNNYNYTYNFPHKFEIKKREIEITADQKTKYYGENDPNLTYQITDGSIIIGENLVGVLKRTGDNNAGEYDIIQDTLINVNNPNYNITFISAKFIISRRNITITALPEQKIYGESDPQLDYYISSGYLDETDTLQGSLSRESGQNVGPYNILQNSLNNDNNPNYNINFLGNTFVISKMDINVSANDTQIVYGDAVPAFTFIVEQAPLPYGDILGFTFATLYTRYGNIGNYNINISLNNDYQAEYANYNIYLENASLTVNPRPLTVTAQSKTISYGEAPPVYTISYSGIVNNDEFFDTASCLYQQYDDAGTYVINVTKYPTSAYDNYSAAYISGTLTVNKKTVVITPLDQTITYGDEIPEFTIVYDIQGLSFDDTATTDYVRYSDAKAYDITVVVRPLEFYGNYIPQYEKGILTVTKAPLTATADNKIVVYGDSAPAYTITYSGLLNNDTIQSGYDTVYSSYQQYDSVGNYPIKINANTYTNYQPTYIDGLLSVLQKDLTVIADDKEITYGDAIPSYTISYVGLVNNDQLNDTLSCSYVRYNNADSYQILIDRNNVYTNYNVGFVDGTLTVNKKALSITADNKFTTYGQVAPAFTFSFVGIVNNDNLTVTATTPYNIYDNAGSYPINIGNRIYTNYIPSYSNGVLVVNKASLTVTAQDKHLIFGAAVPQFTFEYIGIINNDILTTEASSDYQPNSPVGQYAIIITTASYTNYQPVFNNGIIYVTKAQAIITAELEQITYYDRQLQYVQASLNHSETALVFSPSQTYLDVGTYYVTVSSQETLNYLPATVEIKFVIEKRQVFINVNHVTKIYGDSDPELTYEHVGLFEGDTLTGYLERQAGENVASYNIYLGTVTAGDNYQIEFTGNTLTIIPRPLTLTAQPAIKVYGYQDPSFGYVITTGNLIGDDSLSGNLTRETGNDVGEYAILLGSVANSNYSLSLISANLSITPRPITITANDMSKLYGDNDPQLTYTITAGSLAYNDTISDTVSRAEGENVGDYAISINQADNNNYDVTYEGNIFTILPRPITVTAQPQTNVYGEADVELTYTISQGNLVFNDELNGSLIRQSGLNKGQYDISQGTLSNDNYAITYIGSLYTIIARQITLEADEKQKIYGETDPALTYTIIQGNLAYDDEVVGSLVRTTGEIVDTYTISRGTIINQNNTNYDITFINNVFIILRRPITIKAIAREKTYGFNEPQLLYEISQGNVVFGDELRGRLVREENEDKGVYQIYQGTVDNANNANYDISFIGNTFTIKARSITITADRMIKSYGDDDPIFTFRVTSGSLAYIDSLNGQLERTQGEERGLYDINQGTINSQSNSNYNISFVANVLEIVKRSITVTADSLSKVYGEADPELSYTITQGSTAFDERLIGQIVRAEGENVGPYLITRGTLTNENNNNYDIIYIERNFNIYRRPITITPEEKSKVYGYADPSLTYTITNGNLVFSDVLSGSLDRQPGEMVGNYLITNGSLSNTQNANYNIILEEKYFVIDKRILVLVADAKTKIYGESDPAFSFGIIGDGLVGSDVLTGSLGRATGEKTGTYPLTIGTLYNENYEFVIIGGNLIIYPRAITIKANNISFLHGSKDKIDLDYTIIGTPRTEDIDLIHSNIEIFTSAISTSRVGKYKIRLRQVAPLNNYLLSLEEGDLNIVPGEITNVAFEEVSVLYNGSEHEILATGDIDKFDVEYQNNIGVEVGVYHARAIFSKENYTTRVISARLIIMTNKIVTSEIIPQGIVTVEDGFNPYVIPVVMQNRSEEVVAKAQTALGVVDKGREVVNKIVNIGLFQNGDNIELTGSAEIRLLIPKDVENLDNLRLVHITDDHIYDVSYRVVGEYVVFTAEELGNYAFISSTTQAESDSKAIGVLFYAGITFLGLAVVGIIASGFKKRKKRNYSKYI